MYILIPKYNGRVVQLTQTLFYVFKTFYDTSLNITLFCQTIHSFIREYMCKLKKTNLEKGNVTYRIADLQNGQANDSGHEVL